MVSANPGPPGEWPLKWRKRNAAAGRTVQDLQHARHRVSVAERDLVALE